RSALRRARVHRRPAPDARRRSLPAAAPARGQRGAGARAASPRWAAVRLADVRKRNSATLLAETPQPHGVFVDPHGVFVDPHGVFVDRTDTLSNGTAILSRRSKRAPPRAAEMVGVPRWGRGGTKRASLRECDGLGAVG